MPELNKEVCDTQHTTCIFTKKYNLNFDKKIVLNSDKTLCYSEYHKCIQNLRKIITK